MVSVIDEWVARLLGGPIEPGLRVPAAIAAGMVVIGTAVFIVAIMLMAFRRIAKNLK